MIVWECLCDCGNIITVPTSYLTSGDTGSCGCYQKDRINEVCSKNIKNFRFGKLIALEPTEERKYKNIIWKCKCDCGNYTYIPTHSLLSGSSQSCGCLKSKGETKIAQLLLNNNISYISQKTFSDCKFPDTNKPAFFDFYVDNKYIIEYDGEQHFSFSNRGWNTEANYNQTIVRDKIKNDWCRQNNIPIIRIPYTHLENIVIEDLILETSSYVLK